MQYERGISTWQWVTTVIVIIVLIVIGVRVFQKSEPAPAAPAPSIEDKCREMGGEVYTAPRDDGMIWMCVKEFTISKTDPSILDLK